ncbi:MAG: IS110 family transposase [Planctomycetales bacterium]|nr:IS110 family transposase [Planctomycetales bacterium]NIM56572.1 IS110 family transposase [Stutzerimonas stutzeri]
MSHVTEAFQSFVGVDLHKCTVTLSALDTGGEITRLKISTKSTGKIEDWLRSRRAPVWMAVEACPFVEWFIDRFRDCVARIDIADATELSNRRGKRRKTDWNDSLDIAERLSRDECPLGFIADEQLMQLRKRGRHWRSMSRLLSRSKHSMKSMLNAANIRGPKFDSASAQRWFLAHGDLLKPVQQQMFSDFIDVLMLVERHRERLRREIIFATRSKRFADTVSLLMSVPGVGEIWGAIIAAEIGPFDRFPNADTLEFWAGLTADLKESAGRTQSGNITKAGSVTLRWALCQAALTMCLSDAKQEATRQRLIRRIGRPKANVAMGRRLLRILYAMIRDGKPYEGGPPRDRTRAANAAKRKRRTRKEAVSMAT